MHILYSTQFKKDYKRFISSGFRVEKRLEHFNKVLEVLSCNKSLAEKYKNHTLSNDWAGYRECHIEPDFLLIYFIDNKSDTLELARIGSHSELFG